MTTVLANESQHALREYVPDPGAEAPACDEHEFAAIMEGMVADEAPGCSPWSRSMATASTR